MRLKIEMRRYARHDWEWRVIDEDGHLRSEVATGSARWRWLAAWRAKNAKSRLLTADTSRWLSYDEEDGALKDDEGRLA